MIYLFFEEWVNPVFLMGIFLAVFVGFRFLRSFGKADKIPKPVFLGLVSILYGGIVFHVYQTGGIENSRIMMFLRTVYYAGGLLFAVMLGRRIAGSLQKAGDSGEDQDGSGSFFLRLKQGLGAIFMVSLIPILLLSPYVFIRADDYVFSYYTHEIWVHTGSILETIKMALITIGRVYFGWQGTYSSTFLMALQPGIFAEKLYAVVPLFFIGILTLSTWFFLKTLLRDWLKVDKNISAIIIWSYLLVALQCIPAKQSAFFWYNGAIHYIGAYSMLLVMLAFMLKMVMEEKKRSNFIGAAIAAIYVGGGNYVTGVGTIFLVASILLTITIKKAWKRHGRLGIVCGLFLIGFLINSLAPGNFGKLEIVEGYGLFEAGIMAFKISLQHMLGEWMHWTVTALCLFCIPLFWRILKTVDYSFSCPLLVIGYSWCYMASLFFAPLYTTSSATAGRYLNIMYLQWILLLLLDLFYLMGWLKKRYGSKEQDTVWVKEKKYIATVLLSILFVAAVAALGEPAQYTSVHAFFTLSEDDLQAYKEAYWENVRQLKSEEKRVILDSLEMIPELLDPTEADEWHSGIRLYYEKDTVEFTEGEK